MLQFFSTFSFSTFFAHITVLGSTHNEITDNSTISVYPMHTISLYAYVKIHQESADGLCFVLPPFVIPSFSSLPLCPSQFMSKPPRWPLFQCGMFQCVKTTHFQSDFKALSVNSSKPFCCMVVQRQLVLLQVGGWVVGSRHTT